MMSDIGEQKVGATQDPKSGPGKGSARTLDEMPKLDYYGVSNPMALEESRKALLDFVGRTMPLESKIFEFIGAKKHEFQDVPEPTAEELSRENDPSGIKLAKYLDKMKRNEKDRAIFEYNNNMKV